MSARILIANRGEIAIRIARAAAELGHESVAVYARDDAQSLHVHRADAALALPGSGAAAYLDPAALVAAALEAGCQAVHPGYGFLSESAEFAEACAAANLRFIGPAPEVLRRLGDKAQARQVAVDCGVPVLAGTGAVSLEGARAFLAQLPAGQGMVLKAVAGGGGRGMRIVRHADALEAAYAAASSEAQAAFGQGALYCEALMAEARHLEVQVLGDGSGSVMAFGERECTLQRRHQKLVEIAPSPDLSPTVREQMIACALRMARQLRYAGLGTFEFLLDATRPETFVFIEANPRLQVEHTVTEAVYGIDLVQAQIRVGLGQRLAELDLPQDPAPRGHALQLRLNLETMQADGTALPAGGTLQRYEMPSGPGVRVDGYGYAGYSTNPRYDSLMAKLIVHHPSADFAAALRRARRALAETRIEGVGTNAHFLAALLAHPDVARNAVNTRWIDAHAAALVAAAAQLAPSAPLPGAASPQAGSADAGILIPEGVLAVSAPMQGSLIALEVSAGERVRKGQGLALVEAMKMQHLVTAPQAGVVRALPVALNTVVSAGQALVLLDPESGDGDAGDQAAAVDLERIRPDLAECLERHALTLDAARPEAVAKRHAAGGRTARENIEDLVDPGSFIEYGALAIPAQRSRYKIEELRRMGPADGVVGGLATVNAAQFGEDPAQTVVVAYDYTVLAGTQGALNHKKQDRLFQLAEDLQRPLVLFAEGGGGRIDVDYQLTQVSMLDVPTFKAFAALSGQVPVVGVVHGRCFAGNAALLGCCDVIIATRSANIGMGGPAMIEGGGLGVYAAEEIGPASVQSANGVIDVLVDDEAGATAIARQYLAYFQGAVTEWQCADQRLLRSAIPENRLRAYDIRALLHTLADSGSVLELRPGFGRAMITVLARIEGRPFGIIANNPMHLGGAIDADAADKGARFLQLCDAHGLPVLSLCDTPGFMVGPEAEKTAQVRRVSRLFVNAAKLSVPIFTVVLRKGYGLGAMAMAGGDFQDTGFTIAWPSGEFGAMGLEGAVRLAFKKELARIEDPEARQQEFERRVAMLYQHGKALNVASVLEIDGVIDPADTRRWVLRGLQAAGRRLQQGRSRRRSHIETW